MQRTDSDVDKITSKLSQPRGRGWKNLQNAMKVENSGNKLKKNTETTEVKNTMQHRKKTSSSKILTLL